MILILGGGISGISCSWHTGHERCAILEKEPLPLGNLRTLREHGCTWDIGPHVSFTKNAYVRQLLTALTEGGLVAFPAVVRNHYAGHWIDHPAQMSLWQVPEPLRSQCVESFLASRSRTRVPAQTYHQWLHAAFGPVFAEHFPVPYTRKYWCEEPRDLTTDWIGNRIAAPATRDVVDGAHGPLQDNKHYISTVRYPRRGGYARCVTRMLNGAAIKTRTAVAAIDLVARTVTDDQGGVHPFRILINTLPLPVFVGLCRQATPAVLAAARQLVCTQMYLVNLAVPHPALRPEHWAYVYDQALRSVRINVTSNLVANNAPPGWCAIQVEVYAKGTAGAVEDRQDLAAAIAAELTAMGLIDRTLFADGQDMRLTVHHVPHANVAFTPKTAPALRDIWQWLEAYGLAREAGDTLPLTDWEACANRPQRLGSLIMAGRYGQWKYYWSDDCILRGRHIAQCMKGTP